MSLSRQPKLIHINQNIQQRQNQFEPQTFPSRPARRRTLPGPRRPPAAANDHIFPAGPRRQSGHRLRRHGFLIHGKRTFLVSAGMEYARVPRALWRDRLLRLKRAGFNCVEMYTFWNWHEPQEGKFDFTGDHDLDAYLKLVHALGMYAICRVGPYYCAEWDSGGYPLWLRFKPGLSVREDNPPFEAAVDRFFDKLIPIVAANQINRGGVGHPGAAGKRTPGAGWGTDEPNPYFTHLRTRPSRWGWKCRTSSAACITAATPPATRRWTTRRPNPWFTTEFWAVWYDQYGPKPERRRRPTTAAPGRSSRTAATATTTTWPTAARTSATPTTTRTPPLRLRRGGRPGRRPAPDLLHLQARRLVRPQLSGHLGKQPDATEDYKDAATNPAVSVTARIVRPGPSCSWTTPRLPVETQIKGPDAKSSRRRAR